MKKILGLILTTLLFASVATAAFAGDVSSCQPVYGGGEVCRENVKFTINKTVQSPTKGGNYVDNLSTNDPRYAAGAVINFKISITNSGDRDITNLNVVDTFPQFLNYVSGISNANVNGQQINFVIAKLEKGKTVEYVITTKAADAGQLNLAITCVVNKVVATTNEGPEASDQSQVCIEKSIITPTPEIMAKPMIKKVPQTGPETDILFGLISTGALGMFIRRRSK